MNFLERIILLKTEFKQSVTIYIFYICILSPLGIVYVIFFKKTTENYANTYIIKRKGIKYIYNIRTCRINTYISKY